MKSTSIIFQARDFTARLAPRNIVFQVNSYSFAAIGGCKEASIIATGGELDIWDLINWLRFPVTIYDRLGIPAWWGYVHKVTIQQGALEVSVSLDSMVNRAAVAYSYVEPGTSEVGSRKTTAWADNLDSQAEFGIKELLSSAGGLSDAAAEGRRAAILAGQAWPQGGVSLTGTYGSKNKKLTATIICRGWWETLGWKYGSVTAAYSVSNLPTTITDYGIGNVALSTREAQSFAVGDVDLNAKNVTVQVKKVGTPTDNLIIALQADSGGHPSGTDLATITIAGGSLTTSYQILTNALSAETKLPAGTVPWIVARRSGANDASNYYVWAVDNTATYPDGTLALYDTSWSNVAGRDAYFKVDSDDDTDTTRQIANLVDNFGQFLAGTDIEAPSGILQRSYQDGDQDALTIIKSLMASGGANGRRLLASVDPNRRVQIREESAPSTAEYFMDSQARLFGSGGIKVNQLTPPAGVWCRLKDVLPGVVDLTKLVDPSLQFIESSSWSASGGASYEFKGRPGVDSLLSIGG